MFRRKTAVWFLSAATVIIALVVTSQVLKPKNLEPSYWPTEAWRTSTPEEQGIDSAGMADVLLTIRERKTDIHSFLIIRNGYLVADAYFYPYDGSTVHNLASVTKSVMTTLTAIAADQGKIKLDQKVVSFFPGRTIANMDSLKEKITVRHLTSMSSGLDSVGKAMDEGTLKEMMTTDNFVQFALDRKVIWEPGTHFIYDSPGMHLLSAILQQATGMTALDFARQNLFEPLGIHDVIWPADAQGYNWGWGDLYLHPRDAAKIGYLWMNKGQWEGRQIVPRKWVEESVKTQIKTGEDDDYGYGWWISPESGTYTAAGRGGQYIKVPPFLNGFVVTTGGGYDYDEIDPLLNTVRVDLERPLPANPDGVARLEAALEIISQPPAPSPVASLPEVAKTVSGKVIVFEPNPSGLESLKLEFDGSAVATLYLKDTGEPESSPLAVGLDGVYRFSRGEYNLPMCVKGKWEDERTLVAEYDTIGNNDRVILRLSFDGDRVMMEITETAHELGVSLIGQIENR